MSQLMDVSAARQRLLSFFLPVSTEPVALAQAAGRVLAEAVHSASNLPPFPNSSMDGFAVRAADVAAAGEDAPVHLQVVADIPAGQVVETEVGAGQAARIMTGAPLPAGADAVVPVEDTDFNHRQAGLPAPETVQVRHAVAAGDYVRPQGQDVQAGEMVMEPGRRLRPQDAGFLAMLGVAEVLAHRRPRVAVFSSGDELLPVEQPLTAGKIHDSNSYTLAALVESAGAQALVLGIVPDRAQAIEAELDQAVAQDVDLILSSAGVSVGAFDYMRTVVESHGRLDFWRVNMRPGKPLAFGHYRDVPFIGLPGNPVSSFVGFEVFVRPALARLGGELDWQRPVFQVELLEPVASDGRESYLRAVVQGQPGGWTARLTGHQGSGNLRSLVQANALLLVPGGVKSLPSGSKVSAWWL